MRGVGSLVTGVVALATLTGFPGPAFAAEPEPVEREPPAAADYTVDTQGIPEFRPETGPPPVGNGGALIVSGAVLVPGGFVLMRSCFTGACQSRAHLGLGVPLVVAGAGLIGIGGWQTAKWVRWRRGTELNPPAAGGAMLAGGIGAGVGSIIAITIYGFQPAVAIPAMLGVGAGVVLTGIGISRVVRYQRWRSRKLALIPAPIAFVRGAGIGLTGSF